MDGRDIVAMARTGEQGNWKIATVMEFLIKFIWNDANVVPDIVPIKRYENIVFFTNAQGCLRT